MLVGRTGLSPVMVGRSAELDRLAELISTPTPTIALVAGEAGIGKTRLVQELVARAPAGTRILTGQADPDNSGHPLALFLDTLDTLDLLPDTVVDPDMSSAVRDSDRAADARICAAVALVRSLAANAPGLLVFEDLHWADPESLSIFERLAEPDNSPLLLVGTYRPDGLSRRHPAAELLPRLERRHTVSHLQLDRLSPNDVATFLAEVYGEAPSYRVVKALYARTGGNPFFLEELIASSSSMPCEDLDSMPLPWTVAELVRAQLDELDPEVRKIVATASELGRRVPFDVLAAVSGLSEDHLINLLRAAVDSGLLLETEPDVFGFHHEIAREAIKDGLLGRERRRLHEAALDALRRVDSRDHVSMARHAQGAGRFEDMVEEARLGAHSLLNHGSSYQALQLAELGLSEAEDDVDLLALAARAALLAGLVDDAMEYNAHWLRQAREADDVSEEAAALGIQLRVSYEVGDIEAMATVTDALVDVVDRLPTDEQRARAMAAVAQSHMLRDHVDATCEWADKAYELADAHNLSSVRLSAMIEKGSALIHDPALTDEARLLLERAVAEADRIGEHFLAARALNNLMWHAMGQDEADVVRKIIQRQQVHAKAAGWLVGSSHIHALAQLLAIEGDLEGAIAQLDTQDLGAMNQTLWQRGRWSAVLKAGYALEVGDLDTVARYIAEAKPMTERTAPGVVGLELHLACRLGHLDEARRLLPELLETMEAEGFAAPSQAHDIASPWLRAGLPPGDLRPMVELMGSFGGHRLAADHPWHQTLEAQLAEAEGRTAEAAELYLAAGASMDEARPPLAGQRGSIHVGAARCLIALGRLDEARTQAETAGRYLARWKGWRVDELRTVQRRLGLGEDPSGPAVLTPREREVAALLAEGLSNSQLADRLYISPRTAAVHVSNILAKLGMSSRSEVAAWAASGGIEATQ